MDKFMIDSNPLLDQASTVRWVITAGINQLHYPNLDYTGVDGTQKAEGADAAAGTDLTFAEVTLNGKRIVTGVVQASKIMLVSNDYNLESELGEELGLAVGRKVGSDMSGTQAKSGTQGQGIENSITAALDIDTATADTLVLNDFFSPARDCWSAPTGAARVRAS